MRTVNISIRYLGVECALSHHHNNNTKRNDDAAQDMIKGSYSTSVHLLGVCPLPSQGVISIAADGKVKLFLHQPIGDIQAATIELFFNTKHHLCSVHSGPFNLDPNKGPCI